MCSYASTWQAAVVVKYTADLVEVVHKRHSTGQLYMHYVLVTDSIQVLQQRPQVVLVATDTDTSACTHCWRYDRLPVRCAAHHNIFKGLMPWYLILWQELVLRVVARPQLRVSAVSVRCVV
jgi:hypothetical protein